MTVPVARRRRGRLSVASSVSVAAIIALLVLAACAPGATPEPTAAISPSPVSTAAVSPSAEPTLIPATEPTPGSTPEPTPEPTTEPVPSATAGPTPSPTPEPDSSPDPTPAVPQRPTPPPALSAAPTFSPLPSVPPELAGYAMDPGTSLPIVPEAVGGPWWWVGLPVESLDPSLRYTSELPGARDVDPDQRRVSLVARYPSHEDALVIARELRDALEDPEAEAAWLAGAGQPSGAGFDWLGSAAAITPFVQVIDRWLIVSELAYQPEADPGDALDAVPRYQSALALALADSADILVVEDAWAADKGVAFDLTCEGQESAMVTLSQDLADNGVLYDMQPVWLEPGITPEQRRARRTLRLLDVIDTATINQMMGDSDFLELAAIVQEAGEGGATATREALDDLEAYVGGWLITGRPDLEPLTGLLDPEVLAASAPEFARRAAVAVLAGEERRPQDVASGQFAAAPFGAHNEPIPWIMGEAATYAGLEDGQVSLSLGLFNGVAAGLGPLVDYLDANGCTDIKVAFNDYGYGVSLRS